MSCGSWQPDCKKIKPKPCEFRNACYNRVEKNEKPYIAPCESNRMNCQPKAKTNSSNSPPPCCPPPCCPPPICCPPPTCCPPPCFISNQPPPCPYCPLPCQSTNNSSSSASSNCPKDTPKPPLPPRNCLQPCPPPPCCPSPPPPCCPPSCCPPSCCPPSCCPPPCFSPSCCPPPCCPSPCCPSPCCPPACCPPPCCSPCCVSPCCQPCCQPCCPSPCCSPCCPPCISCCPCSNVKIAEVHPCGNYVKLINQSCTKAEYISGCYVVQMQNGCCLSVYKIPPCVYVGAQCCLKIYSCSADPGCHKCPIDLVFKELCKWSCGADINTVFCSCSGEPISCVIGCCCPAICCDCCVPTVCNQKC